MCNDKDYDFTPNAHFMSLKQNNNVILTYVWIDGSVQNVRAKSRTLVTDKKNVTLEDVPIWDFDGSSTEQSSGTNSDVYMRPVALYNDPFFGENNKLVMCDTYNFQDEPTVSNNRLSCLKIMEQAKSFRPMFGIEQEYTLLNSNGRPLGWPQHGFPAPQGPYYCGAGQGAVFGREISDSHYKACLYAGITISGTNAEVMAAQWEYQVGPVEGISMGDQLWMSRYLLLRVAEQFNVGVSFDPKLIEGDWNGSGAHTNYSTLAMREKDGLTHIEKAVEKMSLYQMEHIRDYDPLEGKDNMRRLTGLHETAPITQFTSGVANRAASVRIPRHCAKERRGYLEDRRPASNCDPYKVTARIVDTTCLKK